MCFPKGYYLPCKFSLDAFEEKFTLFSKRYPEKHGSAVFVLQLINKFNITGSVENKKEYQRAERREVVLCHVAKDPALSTGKLSKLWFTYNNSENPQTK